MKIKLLVISITLISSLSATAGELYFKSFDTNKDGVLDKKEFKAHTGKWMDEAGIKDEQRREKYIAKAFKKFDIDGNGSISLNEFNTVSEKNKKEKNKKSKNEKDNK